MVLGGASGFVPRSASVRRRLQRLDAVTARDRTGGKANASSVATRRQKTPQPSSPQQQQVCDILHVTGRQQLSSWRCFQATPLCRGTDWDSIDVTQVSPFAESNRHVQSPSTVRREIVRVSLSSNISDGWTDLVPSDFGRNENTSGGGGELP